MPHKFALNEPPGAGHFDIAALSILLSGRFAHIEYYIPPHSLNNVCDAWQDIHAFINGRIVANPLNMVQSHIWLYATHTHTHTFKREWLLRQILCSAIYRVSSVLIFMGLHSKRGEGGRCGSFRMDVDLRGMTEITLRMWEFVCVWMGFGQLATLCSGTIFKSSWVKIYIFA